MSDDAERERARYEAMAALVENYRRERDEAQARVIDAALIHADLVRERDEARARCERLRELADAAASEQGLAQRRMMDAQRERDEALSRMEDLEADVRYYEDRWERIIGGAYIRGAEAMREACAIRGGDKAYERMTKFRPLASEMKQAVRDAIRTLPIPEEP